MSPDHNSAKYKAQVKRGEASIRAKRAERNRKLKAGWTIRLVRCKPGEWGTPLLTGGPPMKEEWVKPEPKPRKKPRTAAERLADTATAEAEFKRHYPNTLTDAPVEAAVEDNDRSWNEALAAYDAKARSAKAQAARENGKQGGKVKSEAKTRAARENGKQGGRRKKCQSHLPDTSMP